MFIEWNSAFEINVPVIDAEHKYLVQLVNDLYDKYTSNILENDLVDIFTHLANYTSKHFVSEESLMAKINYPGLEKQKEEHRALLKTARSLSEQYIDGSNSITDDTIEFLKSWITHHILGSDSKIGEYVKRNPLPSDWAPEAAFSEVNKNYFKRCTFCKKTWFTFNDFANEKDKKVIGYKIDRTNHMYNLILVNCNCGTTLGLLLSDFVGVSEIPFILDKENDQIIKPSYCLKEGKGMSCHSICACSYTHSILDKLNEASSNI